MKKNILATLLVISSTSAFAQLTVHNNGNVSIGNESENSNITLSVGEISYSDTTYNVTLSLQNKGSGCYNIGGESYAYSQIVRNSGRSFGFRSIAGNCTDGYNYALLGALQGNKGGAAIFGTTTGKILGVDVNGRYAGYFDGDVMVTNSLKGAIVNNADVLTENIQRLHPLSGVLNSISLTTPLEYVVLHPSETETPYDSTSTGGTTAPLSNTLLPIGAKTQYAIAVNTVKSQFPDLIITDAQGNEFVNYTQLVPILLQAIKELKVEIDELKNYANSLQGAKKATTNINLGSSNIIQASISQNTPNPYSGATNIKIIVPDDASDAYLDFITLSGKNIARIPVRNGISELTLNSSDFASGTYIYTLVVNGCQISSKRMIVN